MRHLAEKRERRSKKQPTEQQAIATRRFYALIVMLVLILVLVTSSIIMLATMPQTAVGANEEAQSTEEGGLFSVSSITLNGNTKYREDAVIGESGVYIGQSIFSIDGQTAKEHLLETFPYYESVEVQTVNMHEVHITVTETPVVGVTYAGGFWVPIGRNGKALDQQEIRSDLPKGALYIKSTPPEEGLTVGSAAMDPYAWETLEVLLAAFEQYGLTDVTQIDMSDMSDIRFHWRGQIEVLLGNTTNLTHEIGVVASTIPKILESRGNNVSGRLNVSSYSNEALENQAVFTPSSLLSNPTTAPRPSADGEPAEGTTASQSEE